MSTLRPGRYRWVVLAVGTGAQGATAAVFYGLGAVTPALRAHFGLSVSGVGGLVAAVEVGLVLTLVAWGRASDRLGERPVMVVGLLGTTAALAAAALTRDAIAAGAALLAAGGFAASVNAASGRSVITWFPSESGHPHPGRQAGHLHAGGQRGLAMSVRQTSTPLGGALAALALPAVAVAAGVRGVFVVLAAVCAAAALTVALWVRDPPGSPSRSWLRSRSDDRDGSAEVGRWLDARLGWLCLGSGLLVVPQFVASTFLVELLTSRGVAVGVAGALLAAVQLLGAAGRLGTGVWSDRVGSRIGPLRVVALAVAAGFPVCALAYPGPVGLLVALLLPVAALAICWNGLAFTAAGELAPPERTGTALAVQNTANFASAALTPPAAGALAQYGGWPAALLLGAAAAGSAFLALGQLGQLARSRLATAPQNSRSRW